jgi:hypothetical protein
MPAYCCAVLPFPPAASARLLSTVTLLHLDGRELATSAFLPGNPGDAWSWIVETVAREMGCLEEEVHARDTDVVTVEGIPAYRVEILRPPCFQC